MCYHTSTPAKEKLQELADNQSLRLYADYQQTFHVSGYIRPFLPIRPSNSQNEIQPGRWRLLPDTVKTEEQVASFKLNTLNARAESLFNANTYKEHAGNHHGLLYVDGFFEPHKPEREVVENGKIVKKIDSKAKSENYYIFKPNKEIFTLGILYSPWEDEISGDHYNTFSIITVPANQLLQEIHNEKKRMPLIIADDAQNDWLNTTTKNGTETFLQPYSGELKAHKCYRVTGARGEDTNIPTVQNKIDI